jgi:hypothetical protein
MTFRSDVQRLGQVLGGARGQQPLPPPDGDVGSDQHDRHRGGPRRYENSQPSKEPAVIPIRQLPEQQVTDL